MTCNAKFGSSWLGFAIYESFSISHYDIVVRTFDYRVPFHAAWVYYITAQLHMYRFNCLLQLQTYHVHCISIVQSWEQFVCTGTQVNTKEKSEFDFHSNSDKNTYAFNTWYQKLSLLPTFFVVKLIYVINISRQIWSIIECSGSDTIQCLQTHCIFSSTFSAGLTFPVRAFSALTCLSTALEQWNPHFGESNLWIASWHSINEWSNVLIWYDRKCFWSWSVDSMRDPDGVLSMCRPNQFSEFAEICLFTSLHCHCFQGRILLVLVSHELVSLTLSYVP